MSGADAGYPGTDDQHVEMFARHSPQPTPGSLHATRKKTHRTSAGISSAGAAIAVSGHVRELLTRQIEQTRRRPSGGQLPSSANRSITAFSPKSHSRFIVPDISARYRR